jgi:outer membrane protein assembly factor BamB
MATELKNLVFVGFNSRIAALHRDNGEIVWQWKAPKPTGGAYVSLLLLDEARLIASANGYTYCLDPRTGEQRWYNELSGFGTGVTSIVALGGDNPHHMLLAAAAADEAAASSSAATSASVST